MIENKRKLTIREAIIECRKLHREVYNNAKKGITEYHEPKTVISWYEKGGSRYHLRKLLETKKPEELSISEIDNIIRWNPYLQNCGNPCKTCGNILELDEEFFFISFSFCDEYPCGIQLCNNCIKELQT